MSATVLQGITWGHSRGITPLQAVSQRYSELHPGVEIRWKKRTLQEFADFPIEELTREYDLLVIDHPWVGCAAATRCVLPLNDHLPEAYMADQQSHSVGGSHESYFYADAQWALAIDAATPAASYRADLMDGAGHAVPRTWEEVIALAEKKKVAVPAIPIDILMNFYSFCLALDGKPFASEEELIDHATGVAAIREMQALYSLIDPVMFSLNPIAVAERMSSSNDYWYCPFAYCYSNYSRVGYAAHLLHYTTPVAVNGNPLKTTIGGTGLSVSAYSKHQDEALDFARMAASASCQRTLYVQHGGQPGHGAAWTDPLANELTNGFFKAVLPVMNNGYLRPRYNGYLHFQDHAGTPLQQCLQENGDPERALTAMNLIYRQSRKHAQPLTAV